MGVSNRKVSSSKSRGRRHDDNDDHAHDDFTDAEILEFRGAFRMFDVNGTGVITFDGLKQVMTELGGNPTDEEVQDMINLVDENGTNEIDFDGFVNLMRLRNEDPTENAEQNLRQVFDIFDADGSGFIDRSEIRALMKKLAADLTDEEISQIMDEVDKDGDDMISFEGMFVYDSKKRQ